MKVLKSFIEWVFWMLIVLSPTLAGAIIGGILYLWQQSNWSIILGIVVTCFGILAGILWAERVRKTIGTSMFMSRIMASSHMDWQPEEDKHTTSDAPSETTSEQK